MDFGHDGFGDRGARGVGFQAAAIATATDASIGIYGHMPDLASRTGQARVGMPILYNAAADTGAHEDTDEIFVATPGAIIQLAEGCDLNIVAYRHGFIKLLAYHFAQV